MLRPALRPAIRVGEILEPVLDSSNDLSSFPTADGDGATSSSVDRERERERERTAAAGDDLNRNGNDHLLISAEAGVEGDGRLEPRSTSGFRTVISLASRGEGRPAWTRKKSPPIRWTLMDPIQPL